jgi:hypothetical protein
MKKLIPIALCVFLVFSGCSLWDREMSVKDVTKAETIILKKKPSQGTIHAISITGSGTISGEGEAQLILNGAVYKKKEISGRFSFEFRGDWYSDEAEFRYIPKKVSDGNLTLKYAFRDI